MDFSGADNLEGSYLLPLTRFDTTLGLHASRLNTSIIEQTFAPLDIKSETTGYGVILRQPVYQTGYQEAAVSIGFDLTSWQNNSSPGAWVEEMAQSLVHVGYDVGIPFGWASGMPSAGASGVATTACLQDRPSSLAR